MSRYVVGLDLSLTSSGWAKDGGRTLYDHERELSAGRVISVGKRSDTIVQRWERRKEIHRQIKIGRADLVVVEGPAFSRNAGSTWDRAGLWWAVIGDLLERNIPVAVVPPTVRAMWATGKGNADKASVAAAVARLCPDLNIVSSDIADAVVLALMGSHALGDRPDLDTAYRKRALLSCEWPADITASLLQPYEELLPEELPA